MVKLIIANSERSFDAMRLIIVVEAMIGNTKASITAYNKTGIVWQ